MVTDPLPKFRKPPVIEVYCAIYFRDLTEMNSPHLGAFWEPLKHEFPLTETQPPLPPIFISAAPGQNTLFLQQSFDFSRSWFLSADKGMLIQIQRDRLIVNWRKVDAEAAYPSFDTLKDRFDSIYSTFKQTLTMYSINLPTISGVELGYVNDIITGRCRINEIIPALAPQLLLKDNNIDADTINLNAVFSLEQKRGSLNLSVNTIGDSALRLNIISRWISEMSEHEATDWFAMAHKRTILAFTNCTSEKMHDMWERIQ